MRDFRGIAIARRAGPDNNAALSRLRRVRGERSMARILVVDDEPLVAKAIGEVLASGGHEVIFAGLDSDPAADVLGSSYDLLVTDVLMPETGGWDLIRMVRQNRPTMPVIAISGGGLGVTAELALKISDLVGADAVLTKPVDAHALLGVVNTQLGRAKPN